MKKLRIARRTILKGALGAAAGAAFSRGLLGPAWAQELQSYANLPNLPGPGGLTMQDIRDTGYWPVPSVPPASGEIASKQLAENAYLLTGAGSNVLVVTTGGGAIVVDGGREEHSQALMAAITALPGSGPVHTLFNTSWRPEYSGLNRLVGAAGGRIIAHRRAQEWQTVRVIHPWDTQNPHMPLPAEARANDTFLAYTDAPRDVEIAGVRVQYALLPQAHTDSSIYVYFPDLNVAAIGGIVNGASSVWEGTGDGYRGNWAEIDWWTGARHQGIHSGLQTLENRTREDTVFVPAQGLLLTRTALTAEVVASGRLGNLALSDYLPQSLLAASVEDANLAYNLGAQREMYNSLNSSFNISGAASGRDSRLAAFVAAENRQQFIRVLGNPTVYVYRSVESNWPYVSYPNN